MKTKYGIIKKTPPKFPIRDLLKVPHQGEDLFVGYPAFCQNYFSDNMQKMQKTYLHPLTKKQVSFREPTTAESISASAFKFGELAKPEIFDKKWFQLGRIVKTSEGFFVNPPRDKQRNLIIDKNILKQYLNKAKKIHGIYIVPNGEFEELRDYGFAPYESFINKFQSGYDFAVNPKTNGLARVLEHTENKVALGLQEISKKENYPEEINIFNLDYVSKSMATLVILRGDLNLKGMLAVFGDNRNDSKDGCVFGVCTSEKSE